MALRMDSMLGLTRQVKPHEREWNGLPVDKNLQDDWLEKMNSLRNWSVYSTCEGHLCPAGEGQTKHGRIWLKLNDEFYPQTAALWHNDRAGLQTLLSRYFRNPDTSWDLLHEQNRKTEHIRNFEPPEESDDDAAITSRIETIFAKGPSREQIGLDLDHRQCRNCPYMPRSVVDWFQDTVMALTAFDKALSEQLNN